MLDVLLILIKPYLNYVKIGLLAIGLLYIGWLKYCLMDAESDLKTAQADVVILKNSIQQYKHAYNQLAKKTAEQNAQINAMHDETIRAMAKAEQAKKNALGKLSARDKQIANLNLKAETCEQAVNNAKSELVGSLL